MYDIELISEQEVLGKQFRVYGSHDNPLVLAKDVAIWIEHSNASKMVADAKLDESEMFKGFLGTLTNSYSALFLTEDGLYEVLMQSRKPIAKKFKKEVKKILKTIRKHGMYAEDELLDNPDLFMKTIEKLKEEREARLLAEAKVEMLEVEIEEAMPKLNYYDNILRSPNAMQVTIVAKDYGMGAVEFNKMLHRLGVQYKVGSTWILYADYQDKGFTVSRTVLESGNSYVNTCWTQNGRLFLYKLLKKNGVLPTVEKVMLEWPTHSPEM